MQNLNNRAEALGLLPSLRLLLEERNVTRAAERAGVSQPSMSRALARLRRLFGDPLLVRGPSGTLPTERARALAAALPALLDDVERLVTPPRFDPATATGRFTIVTADYISLVLLPAIVQRVRREAPGLDLDIRNVSSIEGFEHLATTIDLAIGVVEEGGAGLYRQSLFDDDFACLMPRGWRPRGRGG
jgi:DNA-binding transcriptional LysR family regulator